MLSRRQLMNDKIVSAQGENLSLVNVKGSKLNALSVYGKSTQSGTPSPDNPVPIVSAGSVMTTGAQLFDIEEANKFNTQEGYTVSIDGQKIHVVGNNVEYVAVRLFSYQLTLPAGTYTMSIDHPVPYQIRFNSFISIPANQLSGTATFEESVDITHLAITAEIGASFDFEFTLMLNSGSTALPWEPYTGGIPGVNPYAGEINISVSDGGTQSQTLTLSTPGGLPGIPVDSGGNYTDESGQQWICDEIDLKRGKHVQRVGSVLADGTVNKFTASADNVFWNLNTDHTAPGVISNQSYLSIYFSKYFFNANEQGEFIYVMSEKGQEYFDTIEDLNAFCVEKNAEGNPLIIYYPMDPIETDLPAEEIAAYKALHTYTPNTSVGNDADACVKIGYRERKN